MPRLLTDPIPHAEGVKLIADKPAVTRAVFDRLAPELQARAFVITGVEALDAVARVRELVTKLPAGGDFRDLKEEIRQNLSPFLVTSTDPDERAKQESAATRRAELLLRLHGWQAYAQTQHDLMEAHRDAFPFRQYLTSEDGRVRESHAALNRKILPANHPFWQTHTPPWEFNCRCDVVPLTEEEVKDTRAREAHKAPENMDVLPQAQLDEIERNGRMVKANGAGFYDLRTPREKTGDGYEWRPGDRGLDLSQILSRFTPQERAIFEQWARATKLEDGRDLMEWLEKGAQPGAPPAQPPLPPAKPRPRTPRPAATAPAASPSVPSAVPATTAAIPPGGRAVGAALTDHTRSTRKEVARVDRVKNLIDRVHGDGILKDMPVRWAKGSKGHYAAHREIKIGKSGMWASQIAHEIGHKLDFEGITSPGWWASEDTSAGAPLAKVMEAIQNSAAVRNLETKPEYARNRKYKGYQLKKVERWARAYAQFIAEETGDPELLADIAKRLSGQHGYWPDSQWTTQDFAPIRAEIRAAFQSMGWMKTPTTTTP